VATLKELLAELDGDSTPVEKTASASAPANGATTQEIDDVLQQAGLINKDESAVEKTASKIEGGSKPMSLYEALQQEWSQEGVVEKTASEVTEETTETQETDLEKTAAIQERTDVLGELAAGYFNEIAAEEFQKVANAAGIAPDDSMSDKGKATGMFGEVGDVRVATNRPADSEKQIDTKPFHYSLDEGQKALVGLCMKKKILEKSLGGK
jgi:hypothetical protein